MINSISKKLPCILTLLMLAGVSFLTLLFALFLASSRPVGLF